MAKQAQKNCAPMRFDIEITLERDLFIIGTPQDELSGFLRKSLAPIHLYKWIAYAYFNIWIDFDFFNVNCNANIKVNFDVIFFFLKKVGIFYIFLFLTKNKNNSAR